MGESTTSESKIVAFLGPSASYSHQATKKAFPEPEWELKTTAAIRDVFDVVQSSQAAYGVVPFENSTHGTVTFTLDCLANRSDLYTNVSVCGEVYLDVHHFLLGKRPAPSPSTARARPPSYPRGQPLVSLSHIQRIYSHPQAFGQSGAFLGKYLKGVELIDVSSTSKAAQMAAADQTGTSAAIAGEFAGEMIEGLEVLAGSIEDREDNVTRFLVLRRDDGGKDWKWEREGGGEEGGGSDGDGDDDAYGSKYKSLVTFSVPHRTPGALADTLGCFKTLGLNLTSVNSLPSLIEPFQYLFFVEFEGSREDDPEGKVRKLVEDVGRVPVQRWRFWGSWRNMRRRRVGGL